jgi:hypothetical protein
MPKQELIHPSFKSKGFTCPHCNFNSQHNWGDNYFFGIAPKGRIFYAECQLCKKFNIWYEENMIYPDVIAVD